MDLNQATQPLLTELRGGMVEFDNKMQVTADFDRFLRRAEDIARDTQALAYEVSAFDISRLWQMARVPRHRVFTIRQRVFSDSPKEHAGLKHTRGRYNRVQRMLDRQVRYVDWMGRTESEVEEEADLPEVLPDEEAERAEPLPSKLAGGWLLAFFTRWGKVFGTNREKEKERIAIKNFPAEVDSLLESDRLIIIPRVEITNVDNICHNGNKSGLNVYENAITSPPARRRFSISK